MIRIIYYVLCGLLLAWIIYDQTREKPDEEQGEGLGDGYGCQIGEIFRTLAAELKRSGESELYADALFIADKADGRGWRASDLLTAGNCPGISLYEAALLLSEIAKKSKADSAIKDAARALYELNEGAGE